MRTLPTATKIVSSCATSDLPVDNFPTWDSDLFAPFGRKKSASESPP